MSLKELIEVARGDAVADLVFSNARIVNTFTGEIEESSVAVYQGRVAGVGDYTDARQVVDLEGKYLAPASSTATFIWRVPTFTLTNLPGRWCPEEPWPRSLTSTR